MSAVRPSPLSRAQLRQVSKSPSLKPVFAGAHSRYNGDCYSNDISNPTNASLVDKTLTNNGEFSRAHRSDPCLIDSTTDLPVEEPYQLIDHYNQLSLAAGGGCRRRLFESGNLFNGEFELANRNIGIDLNLGARSGWSETFAQNMSLSKSRSTTLCGLENNALYGRTSRSSTRLLSCKKALRCRTNYSTRIPNRDARVPISPGSQRSQDSGFSDSDSQSDERRAIEARCGVLKSPNRVQPRSMKHTKGHLSKSSLNLVKNESIPEGIGSAVRQRSKAGHTPKPRRFTKSRLQVMSERQETTFADTSGVNQGPLTSSPVSSNHILECSAVERELDLILERVEQADLKQQVASQRRSAHNETSIDFNCSTRETRIKKPNVSRTAPTICSVLEKKSNNGKFIESFYEGIASNLRTSIRKQPELKSNESVICVAQVKSAPARHWLNLLLGEVENECMNMLQSKSVISDISHMLALSARDARTNIREIQIRAKSVSREFTKLFKQLEYAEFGEIPAIIKTIEGSIKRFIDECPSSESEENVSEFRAENMNKLRRLISKMSDYVDSCNLMDRTLKIEDLAQVLNSLAQAFNHLVDWLLSEEVKIMLNGLAPENDILCVKLSLRSVASVAQDGSRLCRILVDQQAVPRLVDIVNSNLRHLCSPALRALATICCIDAGLRAFERADGLQAVTAVLSDPLSTDEQRSECAGVIAQVTSPSADTVHDVRQVSHHVELIVRELTGLAATTNSAESLLMAAAALANLTFLNIGAVRLLQHNGTAGVLISAVTTNERHCSSMFVKDQTATVLANMASIVECHSDILRCGALPVLLGFLHEPIPSQEQAGHDNATTQAAERVLQKAAIALSRLCVSQTVSRRVAESGTLQRLVNLCRNAELRNCSDGVLVACLTTLRKVAAATGTGVFKDCNALDLVEPRLLESFLVCSARHESCL